MKSPKRAAEGRRMIWQGHDELDEELCEQGAYQLYDVLTPANESKKGRASELVRKAFWLSDKAETYQRKDPEREEKIYEKAGDHLKESRSLVGLETDSVEHTIGWWKAYRHENNEEVYENLFREHLVKIGDEPLAEECTALLIEAARKGHDQDDWDFVEEKLEEYYEKILPELPSTSSEDG